MFSGRVGLSAVAGEATHIDLHDTPVVDRSVAHVIIKLGDGWGSPRLRTIPPIDLHGASLGNSIALLIIKCDRGDRGGLSAVADDVDLRGSGWIGVVSVVSSSYAIGLQMRQKRPLPPSSSSPSSPR